MHPLNTQERASETSGFVEGADWSVTPLAKHEFRPQFASAAETASEEAVSGTVENRQSCI
jgi:hypothetical protein